jgi:hypothetical protein
LIDENGEVDDNALSNLFWGAEIVDSTPHIIPFVLELFPSANDSGKKEILNCLRSILLETESLYRIRTHLKTYEAIAVGMPTYLELLRHQNPTIREAVASLLSGLYDDADNLLGMLSHQLQHENETEVKLSLLGSITQLVDMKAATLDYSGQNSQHVLRRYISFFEQVLKTTDSRGIRKLAADFLIFRAHPSGLDFEWNPKMYSKPHQAVAEAANVLLEDFPKYGNSIYDREAKRGIIFCLSRAGTFYLQQILSFPNVTSQETHWVAKYLIRIAFYGRFSKYGEYFEQIEALINKKVICAFEFCDEIKSVEKLTQKQVEAIRLIVDNDKFWELPSHLFSLYCGLPDSRDELRALIEKS